MDFEERELELKDALDRALVAYKTAQPSEKGAARERFQALLEEFASLVLASHKFPGQ
jgi:hypothetical protein